MARGWGPIFLSVWVWATFFLFLLLAIVDPLRGMCIQHNYPKAVLYTPSPCQENSLGIVQHISIKRGGTVETFFSAHLWDQTSTWMDGNLMGSCQGLLGWLYNRKGVKSEVIQREEAGREGEEVGSGEGGWVGGPTGGEVWNKRGLMHLYYSNLCSQVQCKQCGSTNHHFNHGGLNGCSVSAVLHWTFH